MALPKQIPFDIDNPNHAAEGDYERWREKMYQRVSEIAEEEDISFGALALLLVDLGISSRMIEYVAATPKPSVGGLKLDLDRFRREIDDYFRGCKRDAEDFLHSSHALFEAAAREAGKDE
jgi:hypothetical protein